jgi:hypothetical protein
MSVKPDLSSFAFSVGDIARLALVCGALLLCEPALAQCANPDGFTPTYPQDNQITCIWPTGTGINLNAPVMPNLFIVQTDDDSCDTFQYTLTVSFTEPLSWSSSGVPNSGYPLSTYGYYESTSLNANVPWVVDWMSNQSPANGTPANNFGYEGGLAQETYQMNGDGNNWTGPGFWIAGVNPSLDPNGSVAQAMLYSQTATPPGAPWWYGHALAIESKTPGVSNGTQQFYQGQGAVSASTFSAGYYYGAPVYGWPDGFGIAQVDGSANPLTDDDFWSWSINLFDGIAIANGPQSRANNFWQDQLELAQNLASSQGKAISTYYPQAFSSTYCSFTATGSGQAGYGNGFWITAYNAGGPTYNNAFASVNPNTGTWVYNWAYTTAVCNRQTDTI